MEVHLWGIRGSLPSPLTPQALEQKFNLLFKKFFAEGYTTADQIQEFLAKTPVHERGGYGGNTACVQVTAQDESGKQQFLIIDGGSGLRRLGDTLLSGPLGQGKGEVHILLTHFHWDHLIGLPFFTPIFIPGNQIHFYAVQSDLEKNIRSVFSKPFFPVAYENLGANLHFHHLEPRQPREIEGFKTTPYQLDHPDPCWGYKIERNGRVFSYCVDTEATRVSEHDMGPDLPLYQNVDLLIFDGQYTVREAAERVHWGHASAPQGVGIAFREQVRRILFAHHDPAASDEKVHNAEMQTKDFVDAYLACAKAAGRYVPDMEWGFACEGMVLKV